MTFNSEPKKLGLSPTRTLILGFLLIILIGTLLLSLPFASADGKTTAFIDAFFTAVSSVCITGLAVVNTAAHWSLFGKIVILLLVHVGGLGFMTLIIGIMVFFGKKITLRERIMIRESFNQNNMQGMVGLVIKVIAGTFIVEAAGAVVLSFVFVPQYGFLKGLWYGMFHSAAAFFNVGFDLIGEESLIPYAGSFTVNAAAALLIILGGLGFVVWLDLLSVFKNIRNKPINSFSEFRRISVGEIKRMSLHSKIALTVTFFLLIFGMVFFFIAEFNNSSTIGDFPLGQKILASFFQSATLRTAGFSTINQSGMGYGSKFMSVIFMLIGGSPGGTAAGIKTVTVTIILFAVISVVRGKDSIIVFNKSIPVKTLQKALAVTTMLLLIFFAAVIALSFTESYGGFEYEFIDILFECASAISTTGLSLGITPHLTSAGKLIICALMFIGRLGPITVAIGLSDNKKSGGNLIHYPEEDIIVG